MTDDDFVAAFESCRLSRQEWTHTAHIRMAWIYLHRGCLPAATDQARTGIQRLNASRGNLEGYHETMTTACT
jgi:hypothetical protein